jgi:putative ABC transport system permease protein
MKYLPLLWSAIARNRTETLLTFLASIVAFMLFGSMIALNAAYSRVLAAMPMDRLYVLCAFQCPGLPIGLSAQLAQVPGVTEVGYTDGLGGYHQDRSLRVGIMVVDADTPNVWSEYPLSAADWELLQATPNGLFFSRKAAAFWHVKKGDAFPVVVAPSIRADGNTTWIFTVLGIFDVGAESQTGQMPDDYVLGNYRYFNESRPLSQQGTGVFFHVAIAREDQAHHVCKLIEARFANSSMPLYCVSIRDDATQLASGGLNNMRYISLAIAAAGLFMILFLCATGVAESVRERLPELGILKTIGFNDRKIHLLVLLEASTPAVIAALLGTVLARVVDSLIAERTTYVLRGLPHPVVSFGVLGMSAVAALVVAGISSIHPLRRIRRMDVAAVLRGR